MADLELNEDPQSTWGATAEYKAAWHEKYGNPVPKSSASKGDWVAFAVSQGADEAEAEASTRDDLASAYGAAGIVSAPSAPMDAKPGQGAGTGPSPSAGDPEKSPTV